MAEDKKSFIAYCDWGDIFDELSDDEAGRLVKHLFDYVRDKNPEPKDKLTKMMFIQIQQSLKRDLVKYGKYIDKQKSNGKKGGRPKKNPTVSQKTQPFFEKPKKADSVNVTVNVNDNVNDTNKKVMDKQVYHGHVYQCYDYIIRYFESHLHPKTEKAKDNWLSTIDKLKRIDKIQYKQIVEIVKKTRADNFWSKNFLSITKLRKKNKDDIMYIIVFNEQIKSNEKQARNNNKTGVSDEYLRNIRKEMES